MFSEVLKKRPIIITLAGPNGAGKSSFYDSFYTHTGLPFVNADILAATLGTDAYEAAALAEQFRRQMVVQRENFVFETVFSDPVGDKVRFLQQAYEAGYTVVLVFIGIAHAGQSATRVNMRVAQGGHDVPDEKIKSRYARTMENLRRALLVLPCVQVYDNSDLRHPYRRVAELEEGTLRLFDPIPAWLAPLLPAR